MTPRTSLAAAPRETTSAQGRERVSEVVLPLVAEEVVLERREVERERVTVAKRVEVEDVDVPTVRSHDNVDVERVRLDLEVTELPQVRVEGSTTIIPVVEEVIVIQKRLILREEVRVTKTRVQQAENVRVPLRRERAEVSVRTPSSSDQQRTEK